MVRRAGNRIPVPGSGDLVDAGAVGHPATPPVRVGHAEPVRQGDLAPTHRIVLLGPHDDAAGRVHHRHPAADLEAELGEVGGMDPQGAVRVGLAPRRRGQQDDRDRMDVAERDRAAHAEDVAPAEVCKLLGDHARIDERLHLVAERLVDHGQDDAPARDRETDDEQLRPLRPPDLPEQHEAHDRPPAGSVAARSAGTPNGASGSASS